MSILCRLFLAFSNFSGVFSPNTIFITTLPIAKRKEAKTIRLAVAKVNVPAISLYEKMGFKRVDGVFKNQFITECDNEEFGYELFL